MLLKGYGKVAFLSTDALAGGNVDGEIGGVTNVAFGVFAKSSTIGIDLCCGTAGGGNCLSMCGGRIGGAFSRMVGLLLLLLLLAEF